MSGKIIPFVICDTNEKFLALVMGSQKAWKKTMETRQVWCPHPDTGSLLPQLQWGQVKSLRFYDTWGYVQVSEGTADTRDACVLKKSNSVVECSSSSGNHELQFLIDRIQQRYELAPEGSYTQYLLKEGGIKIRKKLIEEAAEVVLANDADLSSEVADLLYHLLVLLAHEKLSFSKVLECLQRRVHDS